MSLKSLIKSILPSQLQELFQSLFYRLRSIPMRGDAHTCTCCKHSFNHMIDMHERPNAICPFCNSYERHRLLFFYLEHKTDFFTKRYKVLDIAPVPYMQAIYKSYSNLDYLSADLKSPHAMVHFDLTNIPYPDNSFDFIICYHVLEHIENDHKAIQELYRILTPLGTAILQVPQDLSLEETIEDDTISSPEARFRAYGQSDHVRIYGQDYHLRLEKAGFTVQKDVDHISNTALLKKYAFDANEILHICKKKS